MVVGGGGEGEEELGCELLMERMEGVEGMMPGME